MVTKIKQSSKISERVEVTQEQLWFYTWADLGIHLTNAEGKTEAIGLHYSPHLEMFKSSSSVYSQPTSVLLLSDLLYKQSAGKLRGEGYTGLKNVNRLDVRNCKVMAADHGPTMHKTTEPLCSSSQKLYILKLKKRI